MSFRRELHSRARQMRRTVVLAEGWDERVQRAARLIEDAAIANTIVLRQDDLPRLDDVADLLRTRRPEQAPDDARAAELASNPIVHAVGLVALGDADAAVGGVTCPTADVVRAALWLVGAAEGVDTVSSAFYMFLPDHPGLPDAQGHRGTGAGEAGGTARGIRRHQEASGAVPSFGPSALPSDATAVPPYRPTAVEGWGKAGVLTFTDAGIVPDPTAAQLAEIALSAARDRRRIVGDEPVVAFLSYSTKGSAAGPRVAKVRQAVERFTRLAPEIACDGELQGDAALIPDVARQKAVDSPVAGRANVLVFPDLDSGNIAYKLVQRLAGAVAIGPIIQGLAKPVADLSRGASAEDIVDVAAVTMLQADQLSFIQQEDT